MRVLVLTNMFPTAAKPAYGSFVRDQVDDVRALGVDVEVLAIAGHQSRLNTRGRCPSSNGAGHAVPDWCTRITVSPEPSL